MGFLNDGCVVGRFNASLPNGCHDPPLAACRLDEPQSNGIQGHLALSSASSTDLEERCDDYAEDLVDAVKVLLQGLGEDLNRAGILKTPLRVARAFTFATKGYRQVAEDIVGGALFPEAGVESGFGCGGGFGGMVVVRNIDLFSLCEACLLPFKVCCHVAYISSGLQVVGLSKLSRIADMYARRLQNPQRLAEEISQGLADTIRPLGAAVVLQSWHLPVPGVHSDENTARIVRSKNIFEHSSPTFAGKGRFDDRSGEAWGEFLAILQLEGILVDRSETADCNGSKRDNWCPCLSFDKDCSGVDPFASEPIRNGFGVRVAGENGLYHNSSILSTKIGENVSSMIAAVEVMLHAVGEDTSKEELRLTPACFVRWLWNFRRGHPESDHAAKSCNMDGTIVSMNGHSFIMPPSKAEFTVCMTRDSVYGNNFLCELDAPFCSLCEHHLMPFYGIAHVGYFTTEPEEVIDRSAVLRIVASVSQRLQVQERLTKVIAETMICRYKIQSIMVVLEASHTCMVSRGVEKLGSSTATVAVFGRFATDVSVKIAFLKKITGTAVRRTCA